MSQLPPLVVGAILGALGWLVVGVYIQRRQFERQAKNAGRSVYFELAVNQANLTVAREHGVFQSLSRSSFNRLLPELATWLPAEEVQAIVQAYTAHAGYEQVQRDETIDDTARATVLERAIEVHRAALDALRRRSFDEGELRRMGLADVPLGDQTPSPAHVDVDVRAELTRFFEAFNQRDVDALRELIDPDMIEDYPQSGERIRGADRYLDMLTRFPGIAPSERSRAHIVGGEESWGLSPTFSLLRVSGGDGSYTATGLRRYPDGSDWYVINLLETSGGKVRHITSFFGPLFPPAGWRADLVEPIEP
jgi:SnoaL-like domain